MIEVGDAHQELLTVGVTFVGSYPSDPRQRGKADDVAKAPRGKAIKHHRTKRRRDKDQRQKKKMKKGIGNDRREKKKGPRFGLNLLGGN